MYIMKYLDKLAEKSQIKMISVSQEDKHEFTSFYPVILKDLMESIKAMNIPEMAKWYPRMFEYNLLGGKQKGGQAVVMSYKLLEDPKKLTKENIYLANILGWCVEMFRMSCLMLDDINDHSETRRGVPCWYRVKNAGFTNINDALILENDAYFLLRKYFEDHPCYVSLLNLCHETISISYKGQVLDQLSSCLHQKNLQNFTMDRYRSIVTNKSGYFSFYFPVAVAMNLAGIYNAQLYRKVASVLLQMGHFVQIKNDYLDCFDDMDTSGATLYGDIREGKCTWPAVITLQEATSAQRVVMERCYGRPDEQSVQAVMDVYRAVDLPTLFAREEEEFLNKIRNQIEQTDSEISKKMFYNILEIL